MGFARCFVLLALVGVSIAFSGQYVPKSFYVIDRSGHKSDVVYIRNRRDLQIPYSRMRRGTQSGSQSSASSHASSFASSSATGNAGGYGVGSNDFNPDAFIPDFNNFAQNLQSNIEGLASRFGGTGPEGAQSFASAGSSSNRGGSGSGYANQGAGGSGAGHAGGLGAGHSGGLGAGHAGGLGAGHAGGLGAGHDVGYKGPILFSRFGEDTGTGVKVSGAAEGPQGAFSASSSSIDSDGKIKYSVQSGKY